jgi:type IX secretion system PorP/SprF family membrane protein
MVDLIRKTLVIVIIVLGGYFAKSQDIHYSQMWATPLYVNPAFTGNHECDFRVAANYRQQAASFTIPFTTYTAWGDTRFYPNFLRRKGWFGLGAHLYYDNAGNGDLQKVQGMFFTAYSQGFNSDNSLYGSLGVGVGVTNRSIDKNALIYGDQWDDDKLEWNLGKPSGDITNIKYTSIYYPDFNLGLAVHHLVNSNWMYEVGGSISHINKPQESFFGESGDNNKVGRKLIGHATVQHILTENLLIKPEIYFISHEGVQQILIGANLVAEFEELKLYGGLWYRFGRDIIPTLGIEYNKLSLLFSYDINVSKQHFASNYKGGFEFSLVKKFCARRATKREPCKFLEF